MLRWAVVDSGRGCQTRLTHERTLAGYAADKDGEVVSAGRRAQELSAKLTQLSAEKKRLSEQLTSAIAERGKMNVELGKAAAEASEVDKRLRQATSELSELSKVNEELRKRLRVAERKLSALRKAVPEEVSLPAAADMLQSNEVGSRRKMESALPEKIMILSSPSRKALAAPAVRFGSKTGQKRRKSSVHGPLPEKLELNVAGKAAKENGPSPSPKRSRQDSEWLRQAASFAADTIRQRGSSAALPLDAGESQPPPVVVVDETMGAGDSNGRAASGKDDVVVEDIEGEEKDDVSDEQQQGGPLKTRVKRGHSEWYRQASVLASIAMTDDEKEEEFEGDSGGDEDAYQDAGAVAESKDEGGQEEENGRGQNQRQQDQEEVWHGEYQAEDEWVEQVTEEGHVYYYNTHTGDSQWNDPYAAEQSSYAEAYGSYDASAGEGGEGGEGGGGGGEGGEWRLGHEQEQAGHLTLEQKWEAFEKEINLKPEKFARRKSGNRFKDAKSPSPAKGGAGATKKKMTPKILDTTGEVSKASSTPISPRSVTRAFNRSVPTLHTNL